MATNFIDALLRHRQSSIPELVDVLRDIHHGKTANSQPPPALSAHLDGPESQLPLLIRRLILDGLARGSEDLARLIKPALDAPTGSEDGAARQYSALRDRFDRLERNVRQHAVTVDRRRACQRARRPIRRRSISSAREEDAPPAGFAA